MTVYSPEYTEATLILLTHIYMTVYSPEYTEATLITPNTHIHDCLLS